MYSRPSSSPIPAVGRIALAVALLLLSALPAFAERRLVRVIWDVGKGQVYWRAEPLTEIGHDRFEVPKDAGSATRGKQPFKAMDDKEKVLRKGDRVRIYVVNYNPVSHVWHGDSVVEQIALEPSPVGPILNAAVLAVTGAKKPPSEIISFTKSVIAPAVVPGCPELNVIANKLETLRGKATDLYSSVTKALAEAEAEGLPEASRKLARIPVNRKLWDEFDNAKAWTAIETDKEVLGLDYSTSFPKFEAELKKVGSAADAVNAAQLDLDREITSKPLPESDVCRTRATFLLEQRKNIVAFVEDVAGSDAALHQAAVALKAGKEVWEAYQRRLSGSTWPKNAIELIVKDDVKADVVLRVDGVFESPDKTFGERAQKSLVLGVETFHPILILSGGVGFNGFDFQQIQVVKGTTTAQDGTVSTKDKIQLVDDTAWDPIVPVWLESVRIAGTGDAGFYFTFGTTPDRNIFKNVIAGGSVHVPRWRTVFTLGRIGARGYDEEDLKPVVDTFTGTDTFALPDVEAGNLPLPKEPWHWSWYASVSFAFLTF